MRPARQGTLAWNLAVEGPEALRNTIANVQLRRQSSTPTIFLLLYTTSDTRKSIMTENAPQSGAANAAADASRGMPYYERLRRDLRESLNKKRVIDSNLVRPILREMIPCVSSKTHFCVF